VRAIAAREEKRSQAPSTHTVPGRSEIARNRRAAGGGRALGHVSSRSVKWASSRNYRPQRAVCPAGAGCRDSYPATPGPFIIVPTNHNAPPAVQR
jgi:hypothetical protein